MVLDGNRSHSLELGDFGSPRVGAGDVAIRGAAELLCVCLIEHSLRTTVFLPDDCLLNIAGSHLRLLFPQLLSRERFLSVVILDKIQVVRKADAESPAHLLESLHRKLLSVSIFCDEAMERGLKCEAVHDPELLEKDDACCSEFRFLNPEFARVESEHLGFFIEQLGEDLTLEVTLVV